jgi:lauroyl/myristoyl acyltransferase
MARLIPEPLWPAFCYRLVDVFFLGPRFIGRPLSRRIKEAVRDWPILVEPDEICRAYVSQKFIMQFQYFCSYKPGGWQAKMTLFGQQHLRQALAVGRGAVLWIIPSGSSDLVVKRCLAEEGLNIAHLSDVTHGYSTSQFGVRFINSVNRKIEDRYLAERVVINRAAPSSAVYRLLQLLRQNKIVTIAALENPGGNSADAPVFGCRVPIGVGAFEFARTSRAALLPVFCCLMPTGQYSVFIEMPLPVDQKTLRDKSLQEAMQELGRRIEAHVSKYPNQWNGWPHIRAGSEPGPADNSIWDWIHKADYAQRFTRSGRAG